MTYIIRMAFNIGEHIQAISKKPDTHSQKSYILSSRQTQINAFSDKIPSVQRLQAVSLFLISSSSILE